MVECKTITTPKKTFSVKKDWIEKAIVEAFDIGKRYWALAFRFTPSGDDYFVVDAKTFKKMLDALEHYEAETENRVEDENGIIHFKWEAE